jgi:hypothetical protein
VATATPSAGTVAALIIDYQRSPSFASNLKPSSQKAYLISSATSTGHRLVAEMPRDRVAAYIYEIGAEPPATAKLTKAASSWHHAVRHNWRNDPATEIDSYRRSPMAIGKPPAARP